MSQPDSQPQRPSFWRRLGNRIDANAQALEMSEAEFQHRRIEALEQRVAALERCRPRRSGTGPQAG